MFGIGRLYVGMVLVVVTIPFVVLLSCKPCGTIVMFIKFANKSHKIYNMYIFTHAYFHSLIHTYIHIDICR